MKYCTLLLLGVVANLFSQVGINTSTPDPNTMLDVNGKAKIREIDQFDTNSNADKILVVNSDGIIESVNAEKVVADGSTSSSGNSVGAVKINYNQTGFLRLSGTQTYGLLISNAGSVNINPTYATGAYPNESDSPDDIIWNDAICKDGSNANQNKCIGAILENPVNNQENRYRINATLKLESSSLSETLFLNVKVKSVGSGALVFANSFPIPNSLNVGSEFNIQFYFNTIADSASIGKGYYFEFQADGDLSNNIAIQFNDIVRSN